MTVRRKTSRGVRARGRPAATADVDVRGALLDAAARLFLQHGFDRVSARQIAAAAGATPAMIHYYFTDKAGLFRAMIERAITPVREMLSRAADAGELHPPELTVLMSAQMTAVSANPWIATLLVSEVLPEKGRLRTTFVRDIAQRHAPLLTAIIERGRATGRFRADLDPKLATLSLISLCMFPFIARAVAGPVFGLRYDAEDVQRLIAHTTRLFILGIESSKERP